MRTSLQVNPHLYIGDNTGRPLDFGRVYFGEPNKDPELYPIDIFYDENLTIPASQPVRTKGGFLNANGDMCEIYAAEFEYSIKVLDAYKRQIFYAPNMRKSNAANEIVFKSSYYGAVARTQADINAETISIKDFGAAGDGVTDDTLPTLYFIDAVLSTGKLGYVPTGHYLIKSQIVIDMGRYAISRNQGFRLSGDGLRRSIFKSTYNSDAALIIKNDNFIKSAFYPEIEGIGVENNAPYPCVRIGKYDFSDEINAVKINLSANNADTSAAACGMEINGVYQGVLNVTCNTGGTSTLGDALRIRQGQFLQITGSGGNAANSIHLTGGYSYANVITNWDAEEVKTCIKIDVATAASNTFVGGQFSWSVNAIDATAGNNNIFINPNFGLSKNIAAGVIGVAVIGQGKEFGNIYFPATTFSSINNSDTLVNVNAKSGYQAGIVWSRDSRNMFRLDSNGNTLVTRAWNADQNKFLDAYFIDTAGVMHVNQGAFEYFGLGTQPVGRQAVTGKKSDSSALTSLLSALVKLGLITDTTT